MALRWPARVRLTGPYLDAMQVVGSVDPGQADGARPVGLDLPGPARRIRIEPVKLPDTTPLPEREPAPEPAAPAEPREPEPPKAPEHEPAPERERDPAPAPEPTPA